MALTKQQQDDNRYTLYSSIWMGGGFTIYDKKLGKVVKKYPETYDYKKMTKAVDLLNKKK